MILFLQILIGIWLIVGGLFLLLKFDNWLAHSRYYRLQPWFWALTITSFIALALTGAMLADQDQHANETRRHHEAACQAAP